MTKENEDNVYQEQGIVTIYLPPLKSAELFEIHAALKTALNGLVSYKMDFRIMGQKGMIRPDGGLGNKSGNADESP